MIRLGWEPDFRGRVVIWNNQQLTRLNEVVEEALASKHIVAVDTETNGLDPNTGARMFLYSFAYIVPEAHGDKRRCPVGGGKHAHVRSVSVFVGSRHKEATDDHVPEHDALEALRRIMDGCRVCMFNAKFDMKMLWADAVSTDNVERDGYLDLFVLDSSYGDSLEEVRAARAGKRLQPSSPLPRNLKDLCDILLGWPAEERDEVRAWLASKFGAKKERWRYHHVPRDLISTYACGDVERTLCLCLWATERLEQREQLQLAVMEAQLSACVASCELTGVMLHTAAVEETRNHWQASGERAVDAMLECTGLTRCDYTTDEWLIGYAWPALNDHAGKQYPIPSGWSADDLSHYATKARGKGIEAVPAAGLHGVFCKALLERRLADKVIGTYIDPWLTKHAVNHDGELRLHPGLNQTGAGTGRFSSDDPNLQNVPSEARLITAPPGRSLLFVDYSQIEYRVFAHYAGGDVMEAYIQRPDADFHQTVADMMGIPRKPAKNLNFGILYGMGKDKLVNSLRVLCNMGEADAIRTFNLYHAKVPAARRLYKECEKRCAERGYIRNLFGRRRYLPKDFAHKALNSLIQGGAADIVKRAMLRVHRALLECPTLDAAMCLQIHDELVFECPKGRERELFQFVRPLMVDEPTLKVPLIVEAEYITAGELWMNKKKLPH